MTNGEKFQFSAAAKLFYNKQITENLNFDADASSRAIGIHRQYHISASTNGGFKVRDFYSISNSKYSPYASGGTTLRNRSSLSTGTSTLHIRMLCI